MSNTKRPVAVDDLYRLFNLTGVTISPDGRRVAFAAIRPDAGADDYESRVWVHDRDTAITRPWTRADVRAADPKWSPDGRHLAFLGGSAGRPAQLCVLPADGGDSRQLTDFKHGVSEYAWSPDGLRFALTAATAFASPVAGGAKTEAVRVIETLRYKFNGRGFIFDKNRHVYVLALEGGQPTLVSGSDWDDTSPAWSRDGTRIAFASARHPEREFDLAADIFVVSLDSGETVQITETRGGADSPVFSPDGLTVAYIGTGRKDSMPSHRHVWLTPSAGGGQRSLDADFDRTLSGADGLTWSPDGDRIHALYEDEGRTALMAVDLASGAVQGDREERRQVHSYACAGDGTFAVVAASSAQRPPELYLHDLQGRGGDVRLTAFHDAWLNEVELADMEAYEAESADGTAVPCWLMRPTGPAADASAKVSGVLKIHGGPYAQFGYSFNHELQLHCARGSAVFFCNPRGSSGYGEEWARALGRHRGILDYQDVMACADGAIAQFPFIDGTRLAVTGGSYGGYMTSWIVGHTQRFAVACSEAAPNNLYSMSGSSDLAGSNHRLVYGFTAQEEPDFYMERSPISYAHAIETPLLIIHSENDLRVSIEQGEQLFVALRLQRKPVRFLRFPGENHNLPRSGKPTHRVQRLNHILEWFADYLGPNSSPERMSELVRSG